jgi:hypothetical protein
VANLDKRIENLEHQLRGPKPVRINVVREGPEGREGEEEALYSFVLQPSEDAPCHNREERCGEPE